MGTELVFDEERRVAGGIGRNRFGLAFNSAAIRYRAFLHHVLYKILMIYSFQFLNLSVFNNIPSPL